MKRKLAILVCVVFVVGVLSSGSTWAAKPDKSWKNWFGHFSFGYVAPQDDFGDFVDDTWTLSGGATWWPGAVGLDFELGWTDFDLSKETIRLINDSLEPPSTGEVDDGYITDWSFTVDAIWGPDTSGKVGFYLMGGVGTYYLDGRLTTTGLVYYPPVCGINWCYPGWVGTGNIVVGSESSWEFGYNGGIGINLNLASGSQVYFEVKYHYIDMEESLTYIPFQIGYRW